jgi:hypothetical protein
MLSGGWAGSGPEPHLKSAYSRFSKQALSSTLYVFR